MKNYVGQNFQVKIININQETETLIVSEKAVSDEIAKVKLQKYKVGDVVEGHVVGVVDFGLFVRFDDDLEGLVHISEIAWKKVENPHKEYKIGQKVTAKIVDIGSDYRINLSLKQMVDSPWKSFAKNAKVGDKFIGTVSKIVTYGVIVVSSQDIQGLCHISQLTEASIDNPSKIHEILKVGETKEFTILDLDNDEKLYLTLLPLEKAQKIQEEIAAKKDVEKEKVEEKEVKTEKK
jgi:ribosomal protein S1